MASISSGIAMDSQFMNLKEIRLGDGRPEVNDLLTDGELIFAFSNGARLQLEFKSHVDIRAISKMVSQYIL